MPKKNEPPVRVLFRMPKKKDQGGVYALFPEFLGSYKLYTCTSYERVGQHGIADLRYCIRTSRPARESEYKPLLKELKEIGYNVVVAWKATKHDEAKRREELASSNRLTQAIENAVEKAEAT